LYAITPIAQGGLGEYPHWANVILAFICAIIVLILYKPLVKWGHFTRFKEKDVPV